MNSGKSSEDKRIYLSCNNLILLDITGDFQDLVHDSSDYSSTAYSRRNY